MISFSEFFEPKYSFPCGDFAVRAQLAGLITTLCPNLVDPRGRLLPRSFDVLGDSFVAFGFYNGGIFHAVSSY